MACALVLLAAAAACASRDGVSTEFNANPVTATPVINQIAPTRDALVDTTASAAADIADIALEPIRFFFEISTPGYRFGGTTNPLHQRPATPEERISRRRAQIGLPQTAENRAAARRSQIRTRMGMQR